MTMKISSIDKHEYLSIFEQSLKNAIGFGASVIDEGMRYAALDGGKRIRPLCVYYGARSTGKDADIDEVVHLAVAVELIHNYSLVHDDLPAMDNDDYRRGKLSVHKKFGHANGILIGDQLLTLASCVLLDGARVYGTRFARAAQEISLSAKKMVLGQANDLQGCDSADDFLDMYSQKTAALICGAFGAGAICADADYDQIEKIGEYAMNVGVAFQLADDILDEGESGSIVSVLGKDETRNLLDAQTQRAKERALNFANAKELSEFADALCCRQK